MQRILSSFGHSLVVLCLPHKATPETRRLPKRFELHFCVVMSLCIRHLLLVHHFVSAWLHRKLSLVLPYFHVDSVLLSLQDSMWSQSQDDFPQCLVLHVTAYLTTSNSTIPVDIIQKLIWLADMLPKSVLFDNCMRLWRACITVYSRLGLQLSATCKCGSNFAK